MSDTHTDTVDVNDDLDAFEAEFFEKPTDTLPEDDDSVKNDEPDDTDEPEHAEDEDAPDEDASESEGEDEAEDDEAEEETDLFKAKRRKSANERIRELTAARREAERREADLARRLEELERSTSVEKKEPVSAKPAAQALDAGTPDPDAMLEDGSPKYPLGEFDPHYIRDLTRFTIAAETKAAKDEEARTAREQQMLDAEKQLQTDWSVKLEAAQETLPDFSDKVVVLEDTFRDLDPNYGKYLAATIMSMDKGPEVLHYLATNIGEAKKIVANGPTAATLALGRIEARFDTQTRNDKKTRGTAAPPPPPTNRGRGGGSSTSDDTDNLDAFEKKFFAKR